MASVVSNDKASFESMDEGYASSLDGLSYVP
jgi:hypothetical protein